MTVKAWFLIAVAVISLAPTLLVLGFLVVEARRDHREWRRKNIALWDAFNAAHPPVPRRSPFSDPDLLDAYRSERHEGGQR